MSKLLCEKERRHGGWAEPEKTGFCLRRYDPENDYAFPTRAFCSRHRHKNNKELNDFLSPLLGYLHSCVGQPWNAVWSELCRNLDRRSVSGLHVFSHIESEVETHTIMGEDGKVHTSQWRRRFVGGNHPDGFYVHPVTGLLCYEKNRYRWKPKPVPLDFVWKDEPTSAYVKVKGLWFLVKYEKLGWHYAPPGAYRKPDRFIQRLGIRREFPNEGCDTYWPSKWLQKTNKAGRSSWWWLEAISKKSLNRKELRDLRPLLA